MKKSQLKQLIKSTIREILTEYEDARDSEEYHRDMQAKHDRAEKTKKSPSPAGKETENEKLLNMKIKNPETGEDIKLKSALGYDKSTQVYKAAKTAHDKAVDIVKDEPKKEPDAKEPEADEPTSDDPAKKKDVDWKDLPPGSDERQKALSDKITQDAKDAVKARKERHARGEIEDWEKSDEDRIKDRETAKEKINQIPKEKLKKFQDADDAYKAERATRVDNAIDDAKNKTDDGGNWTMFMDEPDRNDYAPKGHEGEYKAYTALDKDASFESDDERQARRDSKREEEKAATAEKEKAAAAEKEKAEKDLHGNDWHDSKAKKLSYFDTKDGGSYSDMMKKSHSEIDKGNITKDTLPARKQQAAASGHSNEDTTFARKEYDRVVDKAWNKDKEATRDSLINRIYDVQDSPEAKELMKKMKSGDATAKDQSKIEDMTSTGIEDIEYMKNKVGEKNLLQHMERIKKERDHEKKSGVGKFFSKLGLNEEDVKIPIKLKDLIRR